MTTGSRAVREALLELGVTPEKRFGQNFLIDKNAVETICRSLGDLTQETVLEIGPGLGAITEFLLSHSKSYFAVELEREFCRHLRSAFPILGEEDRIHQGDIRQFDLQSFIASEERIVVVSNLPYSISSEVCLWLFSHFKCIKAAHLLLQREFAERIAATPGSRECGSLSVMRSLFADARLGAIISGNSFHPVADVQSRLLCLEIHSEPRFQVNLSFFEQVVRAAFSTRRKTLLNALSHGGLFGSKVEVARICNSISLDSGRRAENLTLEEFVQLTNTLEQSLVVIR